MPVTFASPHDAATQQALTANEARMQVEQIGLDLRAEIERVEWRRAAGWVSDIDADTRVKLLTQDATARAGEIMAGGQRALAEQQAAIPSPESRRQAETSAMLDVGIGGVSLLGGPVAAGTVLGTIGTRRALGAAYDRSAVASAVGDLSPFEKIMSSAADFLMGSNPEQRIRRATVERSPAEALAVAMAANRRDTRLANRSAPERAVDMAAETFGHIAGMLPALTGIGGAVAKGLPGAVTTAGKVVRGATQEAVTFAGAELAGGATPEQAAHGFLVGGGVGAARPLTRAALGARAETVAGRAVEAGVSTSGIAGITYAETGDLASAIGAAAGIAPLSALGMLRRGREARGEGEGAAREPDAATQRTMDFVMGEDATRAFTMGDDTTPRGLVRVARSRPTEERLRSGERRASARITGGEDGPRLRIDGHERPFGPESFAELERIVERAEARGRRDISQRERDEARRVVVGLQEALGRLPADDPMRGFVESLRTRIMDVFETRPAGPSPYITSQKRGALIAVAERTARALGVDPTEVLSRALRPRPELLLLPEEGLKRAASAIGQRVSIRRMKAAPLGREVRFVGKGMVEGDEIAQMGITIPVGRTHEVYAFGEVERASRETPRPSKDARIWSVARVRSADPMAPEFRAEGLTRKQAIELAREDIALVGDEFDPAPPKPRAPTGVPLLPPGKKPKNLGLMVLREAERVVPKNPAGYTRNRVIIEAERLLTKGAMTRTGERIAKRHKGLRAHANMVATAVSHFFVPEEGAPGAERGAVPAEAIPFSRTAGKVSDFLRDVRSTWNTRGKNPTAIARELAHRIRTETGLEREASREILEKATGKKSLGRMNLDEVQRAAAALGDRPGLSAEQRAAASRVRDQIREVAKAGESARRSHAQEAASAARTSKRRQVKFRQEMRRKRKPRKEPPKKEHDPDTRAPNEPLGSIVGPLIWDYVRAKRNVVKKWAPFRIGEKVIDPLMNRMRSVRQTASEHTHDLYDFGRKLRREAGWNPTPEDSRSIRDLLERNKNDILDSRGRPNREYMQDAGDFDVTSPVFRMALHLREQFNDVFLRGHVWDREGKYVDRVLLTMDQAGVRQPSGEIKWMSWDTFGRTKLGEEIVPLVQSQYRKGYYPRIRDFERMDEATATSAYSWVDDKIAGEMLGETSAKKFRDRIKNAHAEQRRLTLNEEILEDPFSAFAIYTKSAYRSLATPVLRDAGSHLNSVLFRNGKPVSGDAADVYRFLVRHSERLVGIPSEFELRVARTVDLIGRTVRETVRSLPGGNHLVARPDARTPDVINWMVNAAYVGALGLRGDVAMRNVLTQGPPIFAKLGSRWTLSGFREWTKEIADKPEDVSGARGRLVAFFEATSGGSERLRRAGITSETARTETLISERFGRSPEFVRNMARGAMYLFDGSEVFLRSVAYLGGYQKYMKFAQTPKERAKMLRTVSPQTRQRIEKILEGELRLEDEVILESTSRELFRNMTREQQAAHEFGHDIGAATQFLYNPENSPVITSNPVGRAVFQFMSYPVNMADFLASLVSGSELGAEKGMQAFRYVMFSYLGLYLASQIADDDDARLSNLKVGRLANDYFLGPVADPLKRGGLPTGPVAQTAMNVAALMGTIGQDAFMSVPELMQDGSVQWDPTRNAWRKVDRDLLLYFGPGLGLRQQGILPQKKGLVGGLGQRAREAFEATQ